MSNNLEALLKSYQVATICTLILYLMSGVYILQQYGISQLDTEPKTHITAVRRPKRNVDALSDLKISPQLCSLVSSLFMIVGVISAPKARKARQSVRETWGSVFNNSNCLKLVFVLGDVYDLTVQDSLDQESSIFGDLLQFRTFIDNYRASTAKTYHFLSWSLQMCSNATLTVRIDNDVWLHVQRFYDYMKLRVVADTPSIYGYKVYSPDNIVVRNPNNKYYVPREEYPKNFYGPYIAGNLMTFHTQSLKRLLLRSVGRRSKVFLDDIFFTEQVAPKANTSLIHIPGFHPDYQSIKQHLCRGKEKMWIHYVTAEDMYVLQNTTCWRSPVFTC